MDQICLVIPILPGRTADAKDFMRELEADRKADYHRSEQRIGIVKEAWYIARPPPETSSSPTWKAPTSPRRCRRSPGPAMSSTCGSSSASPMLLALT
jgi:hypothetical protein